MYCGRNGMAYGYGVQIAPSSDVRTICPSFTKLKASEYTSEYEFICYRPVVEEDEEGEVLENYEEIDLESKSDEFFVVGIDEIIALDESNIAKSGYESEFNSKNPTYEFNYYGWYLVPVDAEGNEVLELNNNAEFSSVKTNVTTNYYLSDSEIPAQFNKQDFDAFVKLAEFYGFADIQLVRSTDPQYYAFYNDETPGGDYNTVSPVLPQLIPGSDILIVRPNLYQEYIDKGYTEIQAQDKVEQATAEMYFIVPIGYAVNPETGELLTAADDSVAGLKGSDIQETTIKDYQYITTITYTIITNVMYAVDSDGNVIKNIIPVPTTVPTTNN